MTKNFEIGQVVYVLAQQSETILPGIVVEEIVVKKISGNSVSWKIKVGANEKAKLYDSSKINGVVYGSLEEVKMATLKQFTEFVEKMCVDAEERVEKWYGKEIAEKQKQLAQSLGYSLPEDKIDPDTMLSSVEEPGTREKIQKSDSSDMRKKLEKMVIDESPENGTSSVADGEMFTIGPNGERIKVNLPRIIN